MIEPVKIIDQQLSRKCRCQVVLVASMAKVAQLAENFKEALDLNKTEVLDAFP